MAKNIILCADCEGTEDQLLRIWDVIQRQQITTNFFLVGETVLDHRDLVKEIARTQNIDSHTYSHANLRKLTKREQRDEIVRGKEVVEEAIGRKTYGFRAPFHAINRDTVDILNEEGFAYDLSVLYYRHDMRNVVEVYPCWFREWTGLYEWLHLSPHFAWHIIRGLFSLCEPLVIPIHPHYSGRDDRFAAAFEEFVVFAKERSAKFVSVPEYLQGIGKWRESSGV